MLPHLTDRPLFVTRFPNGIAGKSFYQKHWETRRPSRAPSRSTPAHNEGDGDYLICENLATLLWLGSDGRARAACLVLPGRPRARRAGPRPHVRGLGGRARPVGAQLPRLHRLRPRPLRLLGQGGQGRGAGAAPPRLHRTRALALRLRELLDALGSGPSSRRRAAPGSTSICRSCATSTSTPHARWPRRSRSTRAASGPKEVTVEWAVERRTGQDLLRLQPEQPREVARRPLSRRGATRRAPSPCRSLGRARVGLPDRLHPSHRPRPAGGRGRPVGGDPRRQAGSGRGRSAWRSA